MDARSLRSGETPHVIPNPCGEQARTDGRTATVLCSKWATMACGGTLMPLDIPATDPRVISRSILKVTGDRPITVSDVLAVEEPLEIRLVGHANGVPFQKSISITMRTPGHDLALTAGFLVSEGILTHPAQIAEITGPKISSCAMRMLSCTLANTVGCTK